MKITKELLDRVYKEAYELQGSTRIHEVLSKITGNSWYHLNFPYQSYIAGDLKKSAEFVECIIKDFGLTGGFKDFGFSVNKAEKTWKLYDYYYEYLGDDLYLMIQGNGNRVLPTSLYYTQKTISEAKEIISRWLDLVVPMIEIIQEKTRFVNLLTQDARGSFSENVIPLGDKLSIDVKKNYMPDLPDESIKEKLMCDHGGIMIFHGIPGTGKSTYIKYLMETMPDTIFTILDPSTIQLSSEAFKNYLIQDSLQVRFNLNAEEGEEVEDTFVTEPDKQSEGFLVSKSYGSQQIQGAAKNSTPGKVYILEDAEKLLLKRNETSNPVNLSNILNITDGIIGDLVKAKFICTFNCDLSEIDDALLRKGRLLQKYEFKALTGDTLRDLQDTLGIPEDKRTTEATLSDLYGWSDENGMENSEKSKIGF